MPWQEELLTDPMRDRAVAERSYGRDRRATRSGGKNPPDGPRQARVPDREDYLDEVARLVAVSERTVYKHFTDNR